MKITIDVEDGVLPEDLEIIAYRIPKVGESYLTVTDVVVASEKNHKYPRLIVRKKWSWPKWLKADWIAMDEDGTWHGYVGISPIYSRDKGEWTNSFSNRGKYFCIPLFVEFDPPVGYRPENSLIENPNPNKDS